MPQNSYTLAELAVKTECVLEGDPTHRISGVSDLVSAQKTDAAFVSDKRYLPAMQKSQAGVFCVASGIPRIPAQNYLITKKPEKAFNLILSLLAPTRDLGSGFSGIHPTAVIHPSVVIGKHVTIGPNVVIDRNTRIGDHTQIGAASVIGVHVEIGEHCVLYPRVTIGETSRIGNRVILQPGVVVGSPGFGYHQDEKGRHIRIPHVGKVVIEDDVEIGANTTIDQAKLGTTRIGRGTKIDNLVQIAHNVQVGEDNIIIAQTGIAGSSTTGKWVILAGQVGINDHVDLGDKVVIAACAAVSKSLPDAGTYNGIPAIPIREYNRREVYLRYIEKYLKRIKALET